MVPPDAVDVVVRLAKVLEIVLAEVGLTSNQFRLLTLVQHDAPSAAELGVRLVMKPPNVSSLTAGLVDRGLVEQHQQPDDGRRRLLSLTPAGRETLATARDRCGAALQYLAAETGDGDELLRALERWLPALDAAAVRVRAETAAEGDPTRAHP